MSHVHRSHQWTDFDDIYAIRRRSRKHVRFGGCVNNASHLGGQIAPQIPLLGLRPLSAFCGRSQDAPHKSKMAVGRHLKNRKIEISPQSFTNLYEIWHRLMMHLGSVHVPDQQLKFSENENSDGGCFSNTVKLVNVY